MLIPLAIRRRCSSCIYQTLCSVRSECRLLYTNTESSRYSIIAVTTRWLQRTRSAHVLPHRSSYPNLSKKINASDGFG